MTIAVKRAQKGVCGSIQASVTLSVEKNSFHVSDRPSSFISLTEPTQTICPLCCLKPLSALRGEKDDNRKTKCLEISKKLRNAASERRFTAYKDLLMSKALSFIPSCLIYLF